MPRKPPDQAPVPLTAADFAAAFPVSRETLARLGDYVALLEKWNRAINLVSRNSLSDPWRRHILDCAQLSSYIPETAKTVVDLGSGAGLPGLILAMLNPEKDFHLIESDRRKSAFLQEAARVTKTRITLETDRIENIIERFANGDVVTARALAPIPTLLEYIEPILNEKKLCIFAKASGINNELAVAAERWDISSDIRPSLSDPRGRIVILEARNRVANEPDRS
jgi:16S rRNA (guanine527-N7)-methyltransferase